MGILNTRKIRKSKFQETGRYLHMLTCYDYQTACLLNETELDLILVGDSLGNVVLGYETTVQVTLEEMMIFASAVKRGARQKFVVADMPFGAYGTFSSGVKNAVRLFQSSQVEALKLEGAFPHNLKLIKRLIQMGIPIMGHIGLTPQSVHELGGYYTHGKKEAEAKRLQEEARALWEAGVFALVLECVSPEVSRTITQQLPIPTIGIGSGGDVDGQVLVINDLLKMGPLKPPSFCVPLIDLYQERKKLIEVYLKQNLGPNLVSSHPPNSHELPSH